MRPLSSAASIALLAAATSVSASAIRVPSPNATVELSPRQSGISPLECTLQLSLVQCCDTIEPLSAVTSIVGPILQAAGIPLPGLSTPVALNCQNTVLGLGCTRSTLCCTTVVPVGNVGINCEPVNPLL